MRALPPPPSPSSSCFMARLLCTSHLRSSTLERTPSCAPIHPWMAVGSGALTALCVATSTVICFATEKNIRNKTLTRRSGPPPWLSSAPPNTLFRDNTSEQGSLSRRIMCPAVRICESVNKLGSDTVKQITEVKDRLPARNL